jgi:copper(I)-binding protein
MTSTFGLAACNNQSTEVAEAPEGLAGLAVENTRLILPAVSGNPAVVYLDLSYDGETPQTIAAVSVEGSDMAMMHEYAEKDYTIQMVPMEKVELTKGTKLSFEPGGKHIRAMNVSPELAAGGKTDVTLMFATGDKHSVTAEIRAAGDAR